MIKHHGSEDYNVAVSAAAKEARAKFEAAIERGRSRTIDAVNQVMTQIPEDRIVSSNKLTFHNEGSVVKVTFPPIGGETITQGFHRNAISQAAQRAGIPLAYIDNLVKSGEWGAELVADNLNKLFAHADPKQRNLTRSVAGEVRGFLSDSYRRMDSRPIVDRFYGAMLKYDAVPYDGFALDTKVAVKMVLPHVFEPVPGEVMVFGASIENSDFGNGAFSFRAFVERLWCTNRAIGREEMRKIHLGAKLGDDLRLSQRTYDLDSQTMASATEDLVEASLSPAGVNRFLNLVRTANDKKVDPSQVMTFLKANLLKEEAEEVTESFASAEIELLPAGQTAWRMSNAISLLANKTADEGRKLELMKVAGLVIDDPNTKAEPVAA
jgi:hypothetical protein